jgi:hypothetical protein
MSDGVQGVTHSSSFITLLDVLVAEHRIAVQYIKADAWTRSVATGVSTAATTVIRQLVLDGQNIAISGQPNQKIDFSNGFLVINEQTASGDGTLSGAVTVNALHMVVYGSADVTVCSCRAGLARPS